MARADAPAVAETLVTLAYGRVRTQLKRVELPYASRPANRNTRPHVTLSHAIDRWRRKRRTTEPDYRWSPWMKQTALPFAETLSHEIDLWYAGRT